jgi:hypothetical protein
MTPYEIFRIHRAVSLHFTTDYDCLKYKFKINIDREKFKQRKDAVFYDRLFKKEVIIRDCANFIIANLLEDTDKYQWVGNLLLPEANTNYLNYIKYIDSLHYNFVNELEKLKNNSVTDLLEIKQPNSYPKLFVMYLQNEINFITLVVINKCVNFIPYWSKFINDTIIWPEYKRKIEKYSTLLHIKDISQYKKAILQHEQNIQEYT